MIKIIKISMMAMLFGFFVSTSIAKEITVTRTVTVNGTREAISSTESPANGTTTHTWRCGPGSGVCFTYTYTYTYDDGTVTYGGGSPSNYSLVEGPQPFIVVINLSESNGEAVSQGELLDYQEYISLDPAGDLFNNYEFTITNN